MIRSFDSLSALRTEALRTNATHRYAMGASSGNAWFGGETPDETLRFSELGDLRLVPRAEEMIDSIDQAIEVPRKVWERSPAGAFPCVPDVIAGLPTPMRRQIEVGDEHQPIEIYVNIVSSGGIDAKVLNKCSTAILALVMALSRVRPIQLSTIAPLHGADTGETVLITRINTAPLDLATACYALTSQGFSRRMNYQLAEKLNQFNGRWPKGWDYGTQGAKYSADLTLRIASNPARTLMIVAPQLNDPIINDPIKWINEQIRHFTSQGEDQ